MILFGAETIPYGKPHGYVIEGSNFNDQGYRLFSMQLFTIEVLEQAIAPWAVIAYAVDTVTRHLREAGVEPRYWDCGGWWHELDPVSWSPYDEHGAYKW
jgi:hypothetical protein